MRTLLRVLNEWSPTFYFSLTTEHEAKITRAEAAILDEFAPLSLERLKHTLGADGWEHQVLLKFGELFGSAPNTVLFSKPKNAQGVIPMYKHPDTDEFLARTWPDRVVEEFSPLSDSILTFSERQPLPVGEPVRDDTQHYLVMGRLLRAHSSLNEGEILHLTKAELIKEQMACEAEQANLLMTKERLLAEADRVLSGDFAPTTLKGRRAIPSGVKRTVWQRDGGQCVQCGLPEDLEFDHVIPWSLGGADSVENLQLLCRSCNGSKGARV
jgi:hypothetical protein